MTGMGDIFNLMRNARQMMDKAKTIQAELARKQAEGQSGAGLVTATVNGVGELVGLRFDKSAVNPDDPEMLADLVIAAVADARKKAHALRTEALKDLTGGMDLSAMGVDLTGLF